MFLPQELSPSTSRNTPPPVQSLESSQQKMPVLILPSRHDSPPKDCLALTWSDVKAEKNSVLRTRSVSCDASNVFQQSKAFVFDSPSGQRTVCLQKTLFYSLPPNSRTSSFGSGRKISPSQDKSRTFQSSSSSPEQTSLFKSPQVVKSPSESPGGKQRGSPVWKTPPGRNLSGYFSEQFETGNPDSHHMRDAQNDGSKWRGQNQPGSDLRSRIGSGKQDHDSQSSGDRKRSGPIGDTKNRRGWKRLGSHHYQGILEQDHPEETPSCGFLGSCLCYLVPFVLLGFLVGTILFLSFKGSPMLATNEVCPKINVSLVKDELEKGLVGQPAAPKLIIDALGGLGVKDRGRPLVMVFHGDSGVGKTHAASIITESVLRESTERDSCIHFFSSDLVLRSDRAQTRQDYDQAISDWLGFQKADQQPCCFSFFIFDELREDASPQLTQALGQALSELNSKVVPSNQDQGTRIFIIMTKTGVQSIVEFLSANMMRGLDRYSLMSTGADNHGPWEHLIANLDKQDPFWTWLPSRDYVRIPFLPLERVHVKYCVKTCLERKNLTVTEERLDWVADQLTYSSVVPPSFSTSGCKKVSGKVDLIHEDKTRPVFDFKKPF